MQIGDFGLTNSLESNAQWSAVHTRHQHEKIAATILAIKGFETFLPTYNVIRQWKDRKKRISLPLFPGYLFVADVCERRPQVLSTPGVCAILSTEGAPAIIPSYEIEAIRRTVSSRYDIEPHPFMKQGDRVRVHSGPLAGVEGFLVRKKDAFRLVVSVEILGRAAAVEINSSSAERLSPASEKCGLANPGRMVQTAA